MDRGPRIPCTSNVRALPLRTERKETVLRWLARQAGLRWNRNCQPRALSKAGQGHARPHHVADGRGAIVCLRTLLRSTRAGVESGERNGQPERKETFRARSRRLSVGPVGCLGQLDRKVGRAEV